MPILDSYLVALALAWIAYFAFHSVLASLRLKHWFATRWPNAISGYRVGYNLLAIALFLPPAWFTLSYAGAELVSWREPWSWAADAFAVAAVIGVLLSLRWYDGQEFLGLRQWRERRGGWFRVGGAQAAALSRLGLPSLSRTGARLVSITLVLPE